MLHIQLHLKPDVEQQLIDLVNQEFNGSYESFVESAVTKRKNILSKLIDIAEDLSIDHDWIGKWQGEPLTRPDQGKYEIREPLQ